MPSSSDASPAPSRALVTGGGARLGRAMALALARRGADVAVHYNASRDAAGATVAEIRAMGRRSNALQADLMDEDATASLVDRAAAALGGPLTVLVNNAAIFDRDTMASATRDGWDRHLGTNLRAPFVLMQRFAAQAPPPLEADGAPCARACVVNMLDQRVRKPTPGFMTYSLSKFALASLTVTAAQALAPAIRVNGIAPGSTMKAARQSEAHFQSQRSAGILERGADPADIVAALAYLCDAPAVTGQIVVVDGGQHLNWKTTDIMDVGSV